MKPIFKFSRRALPKATMRRISELVKDDKKKKELECLVKFEQTTREKFRMKYNKIYMYHLVKEILNSDKKCGLIPKYYDYFQINNLLEGKKCKLYSRLKDLFMLNSCNEYLQGEHIYEQFESQKKIFFMSRKTVQFLPNLYVHEYPILSYIQPYLNLIKSRNTKNSEQLKNILMGNQKEEVDNTFFLCDVHPGEDNLDQLTQFIESQNKEKNAIDDEKKKKIIMGNRDGKFRRTHSIIEMEELIQKVLDEEEEAKNIIKKKQHKKFKSLAINCDIKKTFFKKASMILPKTTMNCSTQKIFITFDKNMNKKTKKTNTQIGIKRISIENESDVIKESVLLENELSNRKFLPLSEFVRKQKEKADKKRQRAKVHSSIASMISSNLADLVNYDKVNSFSIIKSQLHSGAASMRNSNYSLRKRQDNLSMNTVSTLPVKNTAIKDQFKTPRKSLIINNEATVSAMLYKTKTLLKKTSLQLKSEHVKDMKSLSLKTAIECPNIYLRGGLSRGKFCTTLV